MELACHIHTINQMDHLGEVPAHLALFYPPDGPEAAPCWPRSLSTACTRIYVGDEFCIARMPSLPELKRFGGMTLKMGHGLTLLTPVMTDSDIAGAASLFGYLNENLPGTEVVFNDWGVMMYLSAHCPSLKLSAGRILNKGFKDPRLKPSCCSAEDGDRLADSLLNGSTFDGTWIHDYLLAMGIGRGERDLLPYGADAVAADDELATSIYFPFGYVTSGRICWTATFDQSAGNRFMPLGRCSRPCRDFMLELKSTQFVFRIFQSGNTIFFLYPAGRLGSLLETAGSNGRRLVYQGFGFEVS